MPSYISLLIYLDVITLYPNTCANDKSLPSNPTLQIYFDTITMYSSIYIHGKIMLSHYPTLQIYFDTITMYSNIYIHDMIMLSYPRFMITLMQSQCIPVFISMTRICWVTMVTLRLPWLPYVYDTVPTPSVFGWHPHLLFSFKFYYALNGIYFDAITIYSSIYIHDKNMLSYPTFMIYSDAITMYFSFHIHDMICWVTMATLRL